MTTMVITRRFFIVLAFLVASAHLQAQWLTKADEGPSAHAMHSAHMHKSKFAKNGEREEHGVGDAFKWYWRQRTFGLGYIPECASKAAATARCHASSFRDDDPLHAPEWTLVGPTNIGGRMNAIAINPTIPNTRLYRCCQWRRMENNGWRQDLDPAYRSDAIGFHGFPCDRSKQYQYYFCRNRRASGQFDSYAGYGLLRSSDGGKTLVRCWPCSVAAYSRVIVNPKHSNLVYAAAGRSGGGVLRSSDGGIYMVVACGWSPTKSIGFRSGAFDE